MHKEPVWFLDKSAADMLNLKQILVFKYSNKEDLLPIPHIFFGCVCRELSVSSMLPPICPQTAEIALDVAAV